MYQPFLLLLLVLTFINYVFLDADQKSDVYANIFPSLTKDGTFCTWTFVTKYQFTLK